MRTARSWQPVAGSWSLVASPMHWFRGRGVLLVLLVVAVVPYFVDLGGSSIWDANEAFYVETPREMILSGDYVGPTFNFEPRFNKPVLSYWIVAAFYQVFGVSVGVERLPIAIGAVVMIATAFVLALVAASPHGLTRIDAALWAALGLAITPRLLMFSRRIFIDIYISMFMGLTLLCFVLAERFPARRRLFLLLMYGAAGLGVLTKGPVAIALPAIVFGAYLLLHGEVRRLREMWLPAGLLVVMVIVLPWYVMLYHRYGWTYITSFLVGENIARFTDGLGVQTSRPAWFYLPVLFSDSFPWTIFLPCAFAAWIADRRRLPATSSGPAQLAFRVRTILWLWVIGIVGFFSLSAAKQDLYIFPIVPATAALAGVFIARSEDREGASWRGALRWTTAAISVLIALAGLATIYVFYAAGNVYALDGAAFIGVAGAVGGSTALLLALLNRTRASLVAVALVLITLNWVFVLRVLPSFERYKPVPPLSAAIRDHAPPNARVVHYNTSLPSMVYYLGRHVDVLFERGPFIETLRTAEPVYAVLSASDYALLLPEIGVATCVLDRRPTVNVKLKNVLARDPLPEVILITNQCR